MAIRQSSIEEIRYLKRKNLEQEAKIVGNMYRDLIRSHGIDCIYYKLNTDKYNEFKDIIDQNTILYHAYGYDVSPDYSISADMITYMEVENDIFQLNKFGLNPNMDVNFCFDSTDFACNLATKLGQYKEFPIDETEIICEVPECNNEIRYIADPSTNSVVMSCYTSAEVFPYQLGLGYAETISCDLLSGRISAEINGYDIEKEYTIPCHLFEHSDFTSSFPVNSDIYKSFKYKINSDSYIDNLIMLTFKVRKGKISKKKVLLTDEFDYCKKTILDICLSQHSILEFLKKCFPNNDYQSLSKIAVLKDVIANMKVLLKALGFSTEVNYRNVKDITVDLDKCYEACKVFSYEKPIYKYMLHGKVHGAILFYDINKIGKYIEKIHPEVGDIVSIDFPDEKNREKYEITECFDKQLTQDGISPLLHKYIWKCKARRYSNMHEDMEQSLGDERIEEKQTFDNLVKSDIISKLSIYKNNEDSVYGGYENKDLKPHDTEVKEYIKTQTENLQYLDGNELMHIHTFGNKSKLATNGYQLIFTTSTGQQCILNTTKKHIVKEAVFPGNHRFLKATDNKVVFSDITGTAYEIATDDPLEKFALQSIYESSVKNDEVNKNNDMFYKFKNTKTVLFSVFDKLFVRFQNGAIHQLI